MENSEQVRNMTIVDLVNSFPTSVRLRNCINRAQELNKLPFKTIGGYLDSISMAKTKLLGIENLGIKTADELIHLIETVTAGKIKPNSVEAPSESGPSVIDYPEQIRSVRISDLINSYATSVRLRTHANNLPFDTIGDYLDAGSMGNKRLLEVKNFGRKTTAELIHLIDTIIKGNLPEKPKHKKRQDLVITLSEQHPGVFDSLINEYLSTDEGEVLKLERLEKILVELCDKKNKHAEIAWFRFAGETLEEIGKSYGLTRERVRQITSKYQEYMTDTSAQESK